MNQHIHTSNVTLIHTLSTSYPLAVHPVNCYVLHGFTHKLCLFELFFYVFRLQCFHWPTIQPSVSTICILTDVFFTCNWIVCFMHSGIWEHGGYGGKGPNNFFRGRPSPNSYPHWLYVMDKCVVCTGRFVPVSQYLPHHDVPCLMSHIPLRASIYTLTHSYIHNTHNYMYPIQSLYTLKLCVCSIERFKKT